MATTVGCPVPTILDGIVTTTTLNPCPMNIGQIQRMIFWRAGNSVPIASVITASKWTTLAAATGSTKAVYSPFCAAVTFTPGDARAFGGGNETKDGAPIRVGLEPTEVTGRFYYYDQATVAVDFRKLETENIEVLFINENNQLIYKSDTTAKGFPIAIRSLVVKDLNPGDRQTPPHNEFMFTLGALWSEKLAISGASTFFLTAGNAS